MSLKQYLNNNQKVLNKNNTSFSKFQINIVQNNQENIKNYESTNDAANLNKNENNNNKEKNTEKKELNSNINNQNEIIDPNMIKIKFVVNKDEWKKKKRKLNKDFNVSN